MYVVQVQNGQLINVRYTDESENFSRLAALVISVGTLALRTQFNEIYSPGVLHHVLECETVLNDLQILKEKKRISAMQWSKLFPAVHELVSADTFDISLLMVLIRNICYCLPPPSAGWDKLPSSEDTTLSADIARVSYFRNVLAHASEASIDNETFDNYWKILSEALVRLLGESCRPDLDHLKKSTLDPSMGDYYNSRLPRKMEDKGEEEKVQQTG